MEQKKNKNYKTGLDYHDDLIAQMTELCSTFEHRSLIQELITSVVKLGLDKAENVDLKLISSAIKELRYSFNIFSPYRSLKKVTIFGSARSKPEDAEYKMAVSIAKKLAKSGFMIITGAGPGVMEAGNKGASREKSFGVNIQLPFEQRANEFIDGDKKLINFKYFFTRKLIFIKESHATLIFPGGFGTQDEAFENITLFQTGKCAPRPVILIEPPGFKYWDLWLEFVKKSMLEYNFISEEDLKLFSFVTSEDEAVKIIQDFFKVYHSIRRIKGITVLRLKKELSDDKMQIIRNDFKDVFEDGKIDKSDALEEEIIGCEYPELPRLVFKMDHTKHGRLKELINFINKDE